MANFKKAIEQGIIECGQWMIDNSEKLSDTINEGCTDWEIRCSWSTLDDNHTIPKIDISISKYPSRKAIGRITEAYHNSIELQDNIE